MKFSHENKYKEEPELQKKDQESVDIYEKDLETIREITDVLDIEEQRKMISSYISDVLDKFEKSEKNECSYEELFNKLFFIINNKIVIAEGEDDRISNYIFNINRSWSQDQVNRVIDLLETYYTKYNANKDPDDLKLNLYFRELFTTNYKEGQENNTISDLTANYFIKRIEDGDRLNDLLQYSLQYWCQNIQMIDKDIRFDFVFTILNNPSKVSAAIRSEIVSWMAYHGEKIVDDLEENLENNKNNIGKELKIISILDIINKKKNRTGFYKSGIYAFKKLKEINQNKDNYFINLQSGQALRLSLDYYTIKEKRLLIKHNWNVLTTSYLIDDIIIPVIGKEKSDNLKSIDPLDEISLNDKEINSIFNRYRDYDLDYFAWHERENFNSLYHDHSLRLNYDIDPILAKNEYNQNKVVRESPYVRLDDKYGIIYLSDGQVDSYFQLDPNTEKEIKEAKERNGLISESHLEFFLSKFRKALRSSNKEEFLYYLQIRKRLPEALAKEIDSKFNLEIPKKLDINFESKAEFDFMIIEHRDKLMEKFNNLDEKKLQYLIDEFSNELKRRRERAKEKNFGFSSEDTDFLDFFNSFNKVNPSRVNPTAHHTICYYLYLRKDLPEELVEEFEEKFNIYIPENLKEFDTFDDYLKTPNAKILEPFESEPFFNEMTSWLHDKIAELSNKIKESKARPERLTISEILDREGFKKENYSTEDYKKLLLTYKTLTQLPIRHEIENKFRIKLEDYSVREQVQFVNFLATKSVDEVERVNNFLNRSDNKENKINKVKSFLSLEFDNSMGLKIVEIGEYFNNEVGAADMIFAKYVEFVEHLNKNVDDLEDLYKYIFFDRNIDKEKLVKVMMLRANQLLSSAHEKIKSSNSSEVKLEIKSLLQELDKEINNKFKNIEELKDIANDLNEEYFEIMNPGLSLGLTSDEDLINAFNQEEDINTRQQLMQDFYQHKKFSSHRLSEIIDSYQEMADLEFHDKIYEMARSDYEKFKADQGEESAKKFDWVSKLYEYNSKYPEFKSSDKKDYEEVVKKLKKVFPLQKALEKKVDQLVYGYDLAQLPKDFANFESSQVSPEKIPEQAPLYFPVGISKDLPAWESVLKGDMKFAKPIDLHGYLFWLNNQNRKIDLIVCDEIQVNNYQLRYDKSREEAQSLSLMIGKEEAKNYQNIIDSFNLSNIKVIRYEDFLNSNKEKYNHYTQIIEKLKNHPVFEQMFLSMVQESVSGAEKEKYLSYANEELAWILSTDGTKVGHLNEARYDILSALIKNLELVGHKLDIDTINNLDDENVLAILQSIVRNLRDIINEKKSKLEKKSSPFLYYQRLQEHLNKVKIDRNIKADKRIKKNDIVLNFSCPDVGSASFGWRGDLDKNESAVKFKEPYSTYFYKSKGDLLINSDQVVALDDGYISGKILTLEHSKQIDYANNVLKPMLNHYLKVLDTAPREYFEKVAKNKEELIKELNNSQSLLDLLKYIQKYIVKPASL